MSDRGAGFECVSPIDGAAVHRAHYDTRADLDRALDMARKGRAIWRALSLDERCTMIAAAIDHLAQRKGPIAQDLARQMGRPVRFGPGEINGVVERAATMLELAPKALADIDPGPKPGFERRIARMPLGVVAVLAPWNYPFLTSVNAIVPALAAGNAVVLKHSVQTPLAAHEYTAAFAAAGLPDGVFQSVFLTHEDTAQLVGDARVDYVAFTGSVGGGEAISRVLGGRFIAAGLELGGKDPAFIRADADLPAMIDDVADGAFFNSGQSCCAVERIYAHESVFAKVVDGIADYARTLVLGDPLDPATTLGPMASAQGADMVREHIRAAVSAGAQAHLEIDENWGSPYLKPQVLTLVDHTMAVMSEESFGPVVAIMPVKDDAEAVGLMNDSEFGLTASIWTRDVAAARKIGDALETGTVFLNRCDYLDPALAWTGVKNSGRGCTLSVIGYEQLTRPKSFHFKLPEGK